MNGLAPNGPNATKLVNKSVYKCKKSVNQKPGYVLGAACCMMLIGAWLFPPKLDEPAHIVNLEFCLIILVATLAILKALFQVSQESVLVILSIGIQLRTCYWIGTQSTKFIAWSQIEDVVVNEAVSGFRIVHYLAILTKNKKDSHRLIPILLASKLRLPEIISIYRDIQTVIQ